jgi:hypothetical protein
MDLRTCGTLGCLGTFPPTTPVGLPWLEKTGGELMRGLKAQPCPGALFIVYLLFGYYHQKRGEGQQGRESSQPVCRKTWLRLLWAVAHIQAKQNGAGQTKP